MPINNCNNSAISVFFGKWPKCSDWRVNHPTHLVGIPVPEHKLHEGDHLVAQTLGARRPQSEQLDAQSASDGIQT